MKNRYHILPASSPMENPDTYLDFDQVLQGINETKTPSKSFRGYLLAIGILTLLLSAWWGMDQFNLPDANSSPAIPIHDEMPTSPVLPETEDRKKHLDTVPEPEAASTEPVQETRTEEIVETPKEKEAEHDSPALEESPEIENPSAVKSEDQTEMAYVKAVPMEGIAKLYEYFHEELVYPEGDTLSGIMVSTFTITETGEIVDIEIENSLGEAFDKEVIRLLNHMPEWEPASVNGTPVKSKISIPFTFNAP